MREQTLPRRRILGTLAASGLLAGCLGNEDEEPDVTVRVGPDGEFVFEPEEIAIDVGETVAFHWEAGGHSLLVLEQPDGGDWEGVDTTQESGYEHQHTFDTAGRYVFECGPHGDGGMRGEIIVGDGGAGTSVDSDDEDDDEPTPGGAYAAEPRR